MLVLFKERKDDVAHLNQEFSDTADNYTTLSQTEQASVHVSKFNLNVYTVN